MFRLRLFRSNPPGNLAGSHRHVLTCMVDGPSAAPSLLLSLREQVEKSQHAAVSRLIAGDIVYVLDEFFMLYPDGIWRHLSVPSPLTAGLYNKAVRAERESVGA